LADNIKGKWRVCTVLKWLRIGLSDGLSEKVINIQVLRNLAISFSAERLPRFAERSSTTMELKLLQIMPVLMFSR
jgi:hypothetical protein